MDERDGSHGDLRAALKRYFGFEKFRAGQREIIAAALHGQDALALMPTGGGKSLTYQLPALLAPGLTVVVSPLIALMKDQVDRLQANGVAATALYSGLDTAERERRERAALDGSARLLYVAPERLVSPAFLAMLDEIQRRHGLSLLAVDEAHCVSEWGHDFRPEYRQIGSVRERYAETPLLALTATATERVREDIVSQLRLREPLRFVASFNRPNLLYEVRRKGQKSYAELLGVLREMRREEPGAPAIIYCQARNTVETLCARLNDDGMRAAPYHAGLAPEERERNQDAFIRDHIPTLVATIAFGMGIAKPDVRLVAHMDTPRNLESYYQESGRAGRDGDPARCVLFYSPGDRMKAEYFIQQKPDPEQQAIARRHLREALAWAESGECRRRGLLAYFGETLPGENCGACDNCLQPREREDRTVDAQKLLSAVARTGQRFGLAYVVSVLRGAQSQKVIERGHDELSVYGIGGEQSAEAWRRLGQGLVAAGALAEAEAGMSGYPVMRLTPVAWEIMRGQRRFEMTRAEEAPERRVRAPEALDAESGELFETLRAVRRELAEELNVPPYVVFADASLRAMAQRRPGTREQFALMPGVGGRKLEAFGDRFLQAINAWLEARGLEAWPEFAGEAEEARPARRSGGRRERGEGGVKVPSARITLGLYQEGLGLEDIARRRELAISTIVGQLCELIVAGEEVDVGRLVPAAHARSIEEALMRLGGSPLKPVKEALGDEISYEEIHLIRAALRRAGSLPGA